VAHQVIVVRVQGSNADVPRYETVFGVSFWTLALIVCVSTLVLAMVLHVLGMSIMRSDGVGTTAGFWAGADAPVRNALEVASFLSSTCALPIALLAFIVARGQLGELVRQNRHQRAQITLPLYRTLVDEWEGERLGSARQFLQIIASNYDTADAARDAIHAHLLALRYQPPDGAGAIPYQDFRAIMDLLEEFGLLIRNGHIEEHDLFNDIGRSIREMLSLLLEHFMWWRQETQSDNVWANALWLYIHAREYRTFAISNEEVRSALRTTAPAP
jgi:hypothetical protein